MFNRSVFWGEQPSFTSSGRGGRYSHQPAEISPSLATLFRGPTRSLRLRGLRPTRGLISDFRTSKNLRGTGPLGFGRAGRHRWRGALRRRRVFLSRLTSVESDYCVPAHLSAT